MSDHTGSSADIPRVTMGGLPLWISVAILGVGGVIGTWIGTNQSTDWLGLWGFRLTFWGLVVSVAGFIFTIWQLLRTQTAAAAGAEAVGRLRRDFSSLDVIVEIRSAGEAVRETQAKIGEESWQSALAGYNKIRICVDKSLAAQTGLAPDDVEALKEYQAHFLGVCDALDSKIRGDTLQLKTALMTSKLRTFEGFLTQLEYRIRNRFGGKK